MIQNNSDPGAAALSYDPDRELNELYTAITGRRAFSYSPQRDPLYRAYADDYQQSGRLAMRDTMGQAAALTGGYGSSYAQAAGQQQYDAYLRSLSELLPELYGMAYQQYSDQGQALRQAYDLAAGRQQSAYQQDRDRLADERYEAQQQAAAAQTAFKQTQTQYTNLVKLISATGYTPTDAELKAAGLSRAQAAALRQEYLRLNGLLPVAASAGGGGGGGSGKDRTANKKVGKATSNGVTGASVAAGGLKIRVKADGK